MANQQHGIKRVLAKEGIVSANSLPISRSQRRTSNPNNQSIINQPSYEINFIHNNREWIPLGEGWYQITKDGSGNSGRVGLHSVIEAEANQFFMCLYEPKSSEAYSACTNISPEYDLEISIKSMVKSVLNSNNNNSNKTGHILQNIIKNNNNNNNNSNNHNIFHLVLSFKTSSNYIAIICDINSLKWNLIQKKDNIEILLAETSDPGLRSNTFYTLLVQIRGRSISVDLNNKPLFTNIRIKDVNDNLSGLAGIATPSSKIAIKGWKLRGVSSVIGNNNSFNSNNVSNVSSNNTSKSGRLTPLNDNVFQPQSKEQIEEMSKPATTKVKSLAEALGSMKINHETNQKPSIVETSNIFTRIGAPVIPLGGGGPGSKLSSNQLPSNNQNDRGNFMSTPNSDSQNLSILYDRHDRSLVDSVMRDIVQTDLGISFDDIASLDTAKRLLSEAIVLPLVMPEFFTGIRTPWKGVMLFGPPGTGKTLLAKAVCGFSNSTFFNCSASSLISKYRGESEKIVKVLFEAAHLLSPSVVFLDEVDALVSSRRDDEHEASRRLKTEFFSQMDGIQSSGTVGGRVMVLATTNCPWDLDEAMRRRLEKRIYIPLPDEISRLSVFRISLKDIPLSNDVDILELASVTEGYSGADIHVVCREASMMPMRRLLSMLNPKEIQEMRQNGELIIPRVLQNDLLQAISNTKPSVSKEILIKYADFEREYGSH